MVMVRYHQQLEGAHLICIQRFIFTFTEKENQTANGAIRCFLGVSLSKGFLGRCSNRFDVGCPPIQGYRTDQSSLVVYFLLSEGQVWSKSSNLTDLICGKKGADFHIHIAKQRSNGYYNPFSILGSCYPEVQMSTMNSWRTVIWWHLQGSTPSHSWNMKIKTA